NSSLVSDAAASDTRRNPPQRVRPCSPAAPALCNSPLAEKGETMGSFQDGRWMLKAASQLAEHYRSKWESSQPLCIWPPGYQQAIERWQRLYQRARGRGWNGAARHCLRQLLSANVQLAVAVNAGQERLLVEERRQQQTIPSERMVVDELRSLASEFEQVAYDRQSQELVAVTEPITLDEVDLGPFEIRLQLNGIDKLCYRIVALDNRSARGSSRVSHSHVQDETLCEGDGHHAIAVALEEGRLGDFFLLVRQILRTYNSASAYVYLSDWDNVTCTDCGDSVVPSESSGCDRCEETLCESCCCLCDHCDATLCNQCREGCLGCDDRFCTNCLSACADCEEPCCPECLFEGRCPDCHTSYEESHEIDEDEVAPTEEPESPSTDQNETPCPTDIQPLCLGEAAVPA
ncbi:MAG: hypothetical protein KDA80_05190, partial [Planctomycetaceae bacterium]|nr:hypothetical protein [Planctomycetaceae bacterium]